jgi:hypothetical protein
MTSASRAPLMRTSVTTFDERARQRFRVLAYHARYHARDGSEMVEVERVAALVRAGHITVRDGHAALANLRRDQQAA